MEANIVSMEKLKQNLKKHGDDIERFPTVNQYNERIEKIKKYWDDIVAFLLLAYAIFLAIATISEVFNLGWL